MNKLPQVRLIMVIGAVAAFLLIAGYVTIYLFSPFSDFWNNFFLSISSVLAALAAAIPTTLVWRSYEPDEMLYKVWLNFAIGLWLWFFAEVVWMYFALAFGEVADFSIADVFWMIAYIFFSLALLRQYRVVFQKINNGRCFFIITWFLVLAATSLSVYITGNISFGDFLGEFALYFYPFADFAIALFAIVIIYTFRRGTLARPWASLLFFVVSDTVYLWAVVTGLYDWTGTSGDYIRLAADGIYILAYLALAWGIFSQYMVLKFGPGYFSGEKQITTPLAR
jgi:hypothetical protein